MSETSEPPDFDTMAQEAMIPFDTVLDTPNDVVWYEAVKRGIVEQLRQVWNARDAADADLRKAVETVLDQFTQDEAQGYHSRDRQYAIEVLGRALQLVKRDA